MDAIDRKLLSLLQENARYSIKYLASKVFLSSPAVSSRIERLEKSGLITGYHASINALQLGHHITAFIQMTLSPREKENFYGFVQDCPNVLECNCVTGEYAILIKVSFPGTEELDQFIGKLQHFGNTKTQIVFSNIVAPRDFQVVDEDIDEYPRIKSVNL